MLLIVNRTFCIEPPSRKHLPFFVFFFNLCSTEFRRDNCRVCGAASQGHITSSFMSDCTAQEDPGVSRDQGQQQRPDCTGPGEPPQQTPLAIMHCQAVDRATWHWMGGHCDLKALFCPSPNNQTSCVISSVLYNRVLVQTC